MPKAKQNSKPGVDDFITVIDQHLTYNTDKCFTRMETKYDSSTFGDAYEKILDEITNFDNTGWCSDMAEEIQLILNVSLSALDGKIKGDKLHEYIIAVVHNHLINNDDYDDAFEVDDD